ncbi:MAG: flagellar biosynthesis protein FlhF [bacterium]
MKIKRYEAPTLQEALLNVKRDMGVDAVILQTRKFSKGGVLGLMGKDMVEVMAATDVNTMPQAPRETAKEKEGSPPASVTVSLRTEIRELSKLVRGLARADKTTETIQPFPETFGDIYLQLIENDVEESVAQDIIRSIDETLPEEDKNDSAKVKEALSKHLKRLTKITGIIDPPATSSRMVAFVGPTGVGKTTTIAKLATNLALARNKSVGLITVDTYRIAAVEQLKSYADIIGVPMRVVYNVEDMKRAADIFADKAVVLIDTAGRSHRNVERIRELKEILSVCYPLDIHLALNANMRLKELVEICERFKTLSYSHFVITKIDETTTCGNVINLIARFNLGVSYVTYGQNVPDEIKPASVEKITKLILGEPYQKVFGMEKA